MLYNLDLKLYNYVKILSNYLTINNYSQKKRAANKIDSPQPKPKPTFY